MCCRPKHKLAIYIPVQAIGRLPILFENENALMFQSKHFGASLRCGSHVPPNFTPAHVCMHRYKQRIPHHNGQHAGHAL